MTKLPNKDTDYCLTPAELKVGIVALRNAALDSQHFDFAVILSHTHAWLHWLDENKKELGIE